MSLNDDWFTEVASEGGCAFSLKIRERVYAEQTPYQHLAIYDTEAFGYLMTLDGYIMLSTRDNFIYHEMLSHPALFTHARPRRVAIIGGGDCGTLREVLKHDTVEAVTQVDIDERVTRVAERFFPELCERNDDPRAELRFEDGVAWIEAAEAGSLDVIIVDSTDPIGPGEGLFQRPFYQSCLRALASGGLLVQQSESPFLHTESIIKPMQEAMRTAGFLDLLTWHFPQPVYPTGWWTATLACKDEPITSFREEAVDERPFATDYYNSAIHRSATATPEFFRRALMGG